MNMSQSQAIEETEESEKGVGTARSQEVRRVKSKRGQRTGIVKGLDYIGKSDRGRASPGQSPSWRSLG